MSQLPPIVINLEDAETTDSRSGEHWGGLWKQLTPGMSPRGGRLGVSHHRVSPGRTFVPFHTHALEDEVFYILTGRGVLRYGEELIPLVPGDCISCPANSGVAHQILNNGSEDLVYLAIGDHNPHEVCTYPDTGKVMVRSLKQVGRLTKTEYLAGEPQTPKIIEMVAGSRAQVALEVTTRTIGEE